MAVAAARSRRVLIDESRLFGGESYAATSGVYGGEWRMRIGGCRRLADDRGGAPVPLVRMSKAL